MEKKKLSKTGLCLTIFGVLLAANLATTGVLLGTQINASNASNSLKTKYTLYIGTNDKDTYLPVMEFSDCVSKVTEICTKYTDGCTIYEATGYWKDEKSEITKERTVACILEDIVKENVYKICDEAIAALNQNSILIETDSITTTFYSSAA